MGEVGDKWETSAKSRRPEHSEHLECTRRQARDKWRTRGPRIQSVDTPAKSCGPKHSKHPGCKWRQVEEKADGVVGVVGEEWGHPATLHWETSGRQMETSGRHM